MVLLMPLDMYRAPVRRHVALVGIYAARCQCLDAGDGTKLDRGILPLNGSQSESQATVSAWKSSPHATY